MNARLYTAGAVLLGAAFLNAQSQSKPAPEEGRQAASTEASATQEALRQGRVALQPNAQQSPSQTVRQAVDFERYKELAAEREAKKEAGANSANRMSDTGRGKTRHTTAAFNRHRQ